MLMCVCVCFLCFPLFALFANNNTVAAKVYFRLLSFKRAEQTQTRAVQVCHSQTNIKYTRMQIAANTVTFHAI